MSKGLVIAMWSGPRNLSTALMRSFANRDDTNVVFDEPFYASYLVATNKDHPMKDEIIKSQLNGIEDVKKLCQKKHCGVTYQKHMTQHVIDKDLSWLNSLCNCFLIRNPKLVVKSFMKSWKEGEFEDIGFSQQYNIFKYVKENLNNHPVVIDASKLRNNPKKILSNACNILNIDWDESMLEWSPGIEDYDGVWASHWYTSVKNSTSFRPEEEKDINLNDSEKKIVEKAMPIYDELFKYSI